MRVPRDNLKDLSEMSEATIPTQLQHRYPQILKADT